MAEIPEPSGALTGHPDFVYDALAKVLPGLCVLTVVPWLHSGRWPWPHIWWWSDIGAGAGLLVMLGSVAAAYVVGSCLHLFGGCLLYCLRFLIIRGMRPEYEALVGLRPAVSYESRLDVPRLDRAWAGVNDLEKLFMRGYFATLTVSHQARTRLPKYFGEGCLFSNLTVSSLCMLVWSIAERQSFANAWFYRLAFVVLLSGTILLSLRNMDIQIAYLEVLRNQLEAQEPSPTDRRHRETRIGERA